MYEDRYQAFGYHLTSDPREADNGLHFSEEIEANKREIAQLKERVKELGLDTSNIKNSEIDKSKVGRNEPCPCGSGKKYKKCCMRG